MLNEKRIKEAESNISKYLEEGLLKKTKDDIALHIFIKNAKDSLRASKLLLDNKIPLWTIVSSYYSMFYMTNSVLLTLGYKTGESIVHKVTADALIALVRNKLKDQILDDYETIKEEAFSIAEIKSDELVETFDFERKKRNLIQYKTPLDNISKKAETSLERAKEFVFELEKLL